MKWEKKKTKGLQIECVPVSFVIFLNVFYVKEVKAIVRFIFFNVLFVEGGRVIGGGGVAVVVFKLYFFFRFRLN